MNYIFMDINLNDEENMESFLDEHSDFAELVEGMIDACMVHQLKSKEQLNSWMLLQQNNFSLKIQQWLNNKDEFKKGNAL